MTCARYVAELALKNRLDARQEPIMGMNPGRNAPLNLTNDNYVSATAEELEHDPEAPKQKKRWNPLEWRIEFLSITRLAALFPLVILFLWLLVIILLLAQRR
jgi:hypothetical protein